MINSAVLFITWHCNFNCPYCWERQAQKHGEFIPEPYREPQEWIDALNRLNLNILDISGGEPFSQPGFIDIIKGVNARQIAITTNASFDFTRLINEVPRDKLFGFTLSYHPTSKLSYEDFLGKCLLLKNKGYRVTVNFVAYPEQMYLIPTLKERFNKEGLYFHIDPYAPTKYFPYDFNDIEKSWLNSFIADDRRNFFETKMDSDRLCSGGRTHLNIQPDGEAYRCIHDKVIGLRSVGNVFDADFKPFIEDSLCNDWINCSGCDRDKVAITRV